MRLPSLFRVTGNHRRLGVSRELSACQAEAERPAEGLRFQSRHEAIQDHSRYQGRANYQARAADKTGGVADIGHGHCQDGPGGTSHLNSGGKWRAEALLGGVGLRRTLQRYTVPSTVMSLDPLTASATGRSSQGSSTAIKSNPGCVASRPSGRGPLPPFLGHVSHISWRRCVARQSSDHKRDSNHQTLCLQKRTRTGSTFENFALSTGHLSARVRRRPPISAQCCGTSLLY